ncbi:hypothetical protein Y032_0025g1160 [Ancylostoma ceylanicum]|uniref:Uncharacterized protein n=1 Tax=Ancylostoma ceylanicum TaxID=53326 RepID=A0A016UV99_9BILA|nr:hypothetical protein Y032_0025g1160 [Ancylostoma ceylanicum]
MRMLTTCMVVIYELASVSLTFLTICSITKLGNRFKTEKFWRQLVSVFFIGYKNYDREHFSSPSFIRAY